MRSLSSILKVIKFGMAWVFGYAGMWAGKWGIGSLLLKKNIINDAVATILNRTSSSTSQVSFNRKEVLLKNMSAMFESPIKYIFLISGLILLIFLFMIMLQIKKLYLKNFHFWLIAIMPFIWYLILGNHSYIHFWFTYRELSMFIFAILIWICKNLEECNTVNKKNKSYIRLSS